LQMPGERHVACIELHNSSGPPAPKLREFPVSMHDCG